MRSIMYRFLQADNRKLVHRIDHLSHILADLVSKGYRDPDILDELNSTREQLLANNQLLSKENTNVAT